MNKMMGKIKQKAQKNFLALSHLCLKIYL